MTATISLFIARPFVVDVKLDSDQSGLTLAALMIGHHFSISALWKAPSASGVCCARDGMSMPRSAMRLRTPASAMAPTAAALSLPTISLGVALGVQKPCQVET